MDHNLEDTLNLETDMGSMDFDHSGVVVSQEDIALETTGHQDDIHMQFEQIEEQPMLMDTSNEVIVSDFIGDQFNLPDYSIKNESANINTFQTDESDVVIPQSESMIDLQFDPDSMTHVVNTEVQSQPRYIAVKALPPRGKKVESTASSTLPRQVAIAPKPPKLAMGTFASAGQQFAIAPKPIAVMANRSLVKKVVPSGNVLTQVGKQLVMVQGSGAGQKLKLVTSSSGGQSLQYAQIVKNMSSANSKSVLAKVIVQGQGNTEQGGQPAVITKILPSSGVGAQTRYVMQQKTVPLSIGGSKMLFASPTKQGVRFAKKQVVTIKSPNTAKLVPVTTPSGATKLVISTNPNQVILKGPTVSKTAQVIKDGNVVVPGQRSQLHQINVPGKGVQYIRLITNPTKSATQKTPTSTAIVMPQKNFVFTDAKVTAKPQKKFVRIAPLAPKAVPPTTQSQRSSQSLLAPLSPVRDARLEDMAELKEIQERTEEHEQEDSKTMLQSLIANTVDSQSEGMHSVHEVEVEFESQQAEDDNRHSIEQYTNREDYILSTNYEKKMREDSETRSMDGQTYHDTMNIEVEGMPYLSPKEATSDLDRIKDNEALRPRKACNCTKSQCLKLYCDCFANGEFCHRCNCNNCHNNLENEELRQKAIRACLDRNPNAFRPKIGKAKTGGPDLIRRHNKGCNCKRSGCLKNYCECYEAKIACTTMCKCVGCRNVEETIERRRARANKQDAMFRPPALSHLRQPCSFMTSEVIEAVCQCLLAAAADSDAPTELKPEADPVSDVIEEFARCLQDIINASHQSTSIPVEGQT